MMKCRECGSEMYVDDTDRINKLSKDVYYNCPKCMTSCISIIRLGVLLEEHWHSENDEVKDEVIEYNK